MNFKLTGFETSFRSSLNCISHMFAFQLKEDFDSDHLHFDVLKRLSNEFLQNKITEKFLSLFNNFKFQIQIPSLALILWFQHSLGFVISIQFSVEIAT